MNKQQLSVNTFLSGYNCAQSVITTFSTELKLDTDLAKKLATGLVAGLNYQGKTCGAVTGAYLVLGLKFGSVDQKDIESKALVREKIDAYNKAFIESFGSLECSKLLDADITDPDILNNLRSENVFHTKCPKFIERSVGIIEDLSVA